MNSCEYLSDSDILRVLKLVVANSERFGDFIFFIGDNLSKNLENDDPLETAGKEGGDDFFSCAGWDTDMEECVDNSDGDGDMEMDDNMVASENSVSDLNSDVDKPIPWP